MFEEFIKEQEPFAQKENFWKVLLSAAKIFNIVMEDVKLTINNFFPFLADSEYLEKHRLSFQIYKLKNFTENDIRNKCTFAYETNFHVGERKSLFEFLELYFYHRYYINEAPTNVERGFVLYIKDLTIDEKDLCEDLLTFWLDPDCLFWVNNYVFLPETAKVGYFKISYGKIGKVG